jgi:hypothetical protein
MSQLTLNFEPTLPQRWPTLREYIAYLSVTTAKQQKAQAADMDMAPSTLSRKLNPSEGDTQRLNIDDLEAWLYSTGEASRVVAYLVAKWLDSEDTKRSRLFDKAQALMAELAQVLPALKTVEMAA